MEYESDQNAKDIVYEEQAVAFLDILGFRKKVTESGDQAKIIINNIDRALKHTLECLALDNGPDLFSARLFSDCMCLSCDISDLEWLLRELSFLQWNLACHEIFVRGAATIGFHFENDRMIFSEGLVKAYELQSNDIYPRILISEQLICKINEEPDSEQLRDLYIIKAPDGKLMLDYLEGIFDIVQGVESDMIYEFHKVSIIKQIKSNINDNRVLEKYRWLVKYHNHKFNCTYNKKEYEGYEDEWQEIFDKFFIPLDVFPQFQKS